MGGRGGSSATASAASNTMTMEERIEASRVRPLNYAGLDSSDYTDNVTVAMIIDDYDYISTPYAATIVDQACQQGEDALYSYRQAMNATVNSPRYVASLDIAEDRINTANNLIDNLVTRGEITSKAADDIKQIIKINYIPFQYRT